MKGVRVDIKELLRNVELFDGLTDDDLTEVAAICEQRQLKVGEILAKQGEIGRELFIVSDGLVEVTVRERTIPRVVVNLGTGQLIGEMSLVDHGPRSATVCAIHTPTNVQVIQHDDFQELCQRNTRIGYLVMSNLAADLSFKLRHQNLSEE
jgi:CRP-like cAMP-binding protein